jgi:hypothetical protein
LLCGAEAVPAHAEAAISVAAAVAMVLRFMSGP